MKKNYMLYTVISIICIIAIGVAVYYQIFVVNSKQDPTPHNVLPENKITSVAEEIEETKTEFNSLFTNLINFQRTTVSGVTKVDESKEIVYTAYNIKEEKDGKYNVDMKIPVINIKGEVVDEFNQTTQKVFADKAGEILNKAEMYTVYNIDYIAFVNGDILSVAIQSTLKEGNNSQRVIVQTYNYNWRTGERVALNDILALQGKSTTAVNEKIAKQVKEAARQTEELSQALGQTTGTTVYKRDLESAIYITDNVSNFLVGKDGTIYIIYAYGNNNFTSELDVIKI